MADAFVLTLLARNAFRPGDLGWVSKEGVTKLHRSIGGAEGLPAGSFLVRALDLVKAGTHGRFVRE